MVKKEPNSTIKSDSPLTPPNALHYQSYSQSFEDEKIDLYELWMTLWNKKWLVIATTLVVAIGSVVFALRQPLIYKAEALLLPTKSKYIQSLNVQGVQKLGQNAKMKGIDAGSIFSYFKQSLQSRVLQKKFINEFGIIGLMAPNRSPETRDEEIFENFAQMINVKNQGGRPKGGDS